MAITDGSVSGANVPGTLRRLKAYYGLTDREIALASGMKRSTVQSRMAGSDTTATELDKLAQALHVPVVVLFMRPDEALRWVLDHPFAEPAEPIDAPGDSAKGVYLSSAAPKAA